MSYPWNGKANVTFLHCVSSFNFETKKKQEIHSSTDILLKLNHYISVDIIVVMNIKLLYRRIIPKYLLPKYFTPDNT